jgi:hypothetical protein
MSAPRTVARSRVVGAVLAILLVTVAAVAERLSDPNSSEEYGSSDLRRAPVEATVDYQSGSLRVSDVRVGSQLVDGRSSFATKGLFVVTTVTLSATGRDALRVSSSRLLASDGVTYLPAFSLASVKADPGFETTQDLVFEVDPTRIAGATLELWDQGIVFRYFVRTQTPLGITAANEAQWADAGRGRTVDVVTRGTTQALS